MSKTRNKNTDTPVEKTSKSTGTRGEPAFQRDQSGSHGNKQPATRIPSSGSGKKF